MLIIGSGMAGLLAANMLRHHSPTVVERQSSLPNNHSAVLRFRSSIVGDVLNINFRPVQMIKTALPWRNPIADALAYAKKNGGVYRSDRSITAGLVAETRYIAPSDLIQQMAERINPIKFDYQFGKVDLIPGPIISTIPMPALMKLLDYPDQPEFSYVDGVNIQARIPDCDAYVSLLIPEPRFTFSRISLMGDMMIVEYPTKVIGTDNASMAAALLGIDSVRDVVIIPQTYAKINPIDDDARKNFIHWATEQHNIYSLGRFATWRPGLQLDSLVNDIRLIDRWLAPSGSYERHRRV